MNMKFEKSGIVFEFRNGKYNGHKVEFEYKATGCENKHGNDGFYYGSEFDLKNEAMLCKIKVNGKDVNGVKLPPDELVKVAEFARSEKLNFMNTFNSLVDDLVQGRLNITFSQVGCDYVHYQAWIKEIEKPFDVQDIMASAIKIVSPKTFTNACDFLANCAKFKYGEDFNRLNLGDMFQVNFMDLVTPYLDMINIKTNKHEQHRTSIFALAKQTGIKQELSRATESCCDANEECNMDIVIKYAMPDGTVTIERQHTW